MTFRPDSFMAIGFMGPMSPNTATASTPTNCCSIPMPGALPDGWYGAMSISPIAPGAHAKTCRSIGVTMRAACRRPTPCFGHQPRNWGRRELRPNIPWEDTIIYEAHVKGLTQKRSDVPPNLRGTYGGGSCGPPNAHHHRHRR